MGFGDFWKDIGIIVEEEEDVRAFENYKQKKSEKKKVGKKT